MINISVSMRLPSTTCTMENGSESTRAQSARRKSSTKYAWGPSAGEKDADRRVKDEKTEKLPRLLRKKEGLITAVRRSQPSSAREQEDEIERIKRANRRESLAFGNATADESRPNSARSISPDSSAVTGGEGGGNSSQNIWIEFENHIKSIDDDSSKIRTFQQNKVNFRSSETFQKVAGEFRSEKSRQNIGFGTNLRIKKFTANRSNKHQETEPQHGEKETETENQINPEKETKQGKPMRWSVIKQGVKEVQEEKKEKTQEILQAASQLNEIDLKKQDLYIRYGIIPAKGHAKPTNTMIPKINPRFVSKEFLASYKVLHPTLDYLDYREGRTRRGRRVQSAFT